MLRVVFVLENTSMMRTYWPEWREAFVEPLLNEIERSGAAGTKFELAIVTFSTLSASCRCAILWC